MFFSSLYFTLFTVLDRNVVYWRGQIWQFFSQHTIQGDSEENVNILEGNSMGHWEKKVYERLSDSEELTREKYLNPARNALLSHFSDEWDDYLWGWMQREVYKRIVDTRDELLVHILDAAARIKLQSGTRTKKKTAVFAKSYKVNRSWRWDFRKFFVNRKKFGIWIWN